MTMQEHRLKTLRRNLQYARWPTQELLLLFLRHVAMPMIHGYVALAADVVETRELVVDKGLERRYVETAHCGRRILLQERDDGEKRRLRLARCRGRGKQDIGIGIENGIAGCGLDSAELAPALRVDITLDGRGIA